MNSQCRASCSSDQGINPSSSSWKTVIGMGGMSMEMGVVEE